MTTKEPSRSSFTPALGRNPDDCFSRISDVGPIFVLLRRHCRGFEVAGVAVTAFARRDRTGRALDDHICPKPLFALRPEIK